MFSRSLCCRAGTAVRLSSRTRTTWNCRRAAFSSTTAYLERENKEEHVTYFQKVWSQKLDPKGRGADAPILSTEYINKKRAEIKAIVTALNERRVRAKEELEAFFTENPGVDKVLERIRKDEAAAKLKRNEELRKEGKDPDYEKSHVGKRTLEQRLKLQEQREEKQRLDIDAAKRVIESLELYSKQPSATKKTLEEYERDIILQERINIVERTNATMIEKRERNKEAKRLEEEMLTIKELPGDPKEDVLFDTLFGIRTIELNRPEKLHSLNGSMIRKIVPRLKEWMKSDLANMIIIKGSGPKAFCAGGDVADLARDNTTGEEGQKRSAAYFATEYRLDHLIATYPKPFIAFMDGYTMGGGVGMSIHAPIRIATERTVFAMPETTIGFFPDVGASFFLPRMNGAVGTYLALTSQRLKGVNAFYAGIATHYLHSTQLYSLERRLAELPFKDHATQEERLDLINATIEEFTTGLPYNEPMVISGEVREAIDRCFSKNTVPEIIVALREEAGEDSPTKKWAEETLTTLHKRSPTSVYVSLKQMQLGRKWSIKETFQREYEMAAKFMKHPDFTEGVHALLIRKDGKPKWDPMTIEEASSNRSIADPFFLVEGAQRLKLLSENDYQEYPYSKYGIPTEEHIEDVVRDLKKGHKDLMKYFMRERNGKQGVREVVEEVLNRKTTLKNGAVLWNEDSDMASKL